MLGTSGARRNVAGRSVAEERVEPNAREPALVEQRNEQWQRAHGRGLEVVVLGGIVEHHDRAVVSVRPTRSTMASELRYVGS